MTQETFDPITRNIRAIETEARVVIASAETAIASMRRKRNPTVAAYQDTFNKLGECLQATNAAHDLVVAHAHLVADNIATRSRTNVLNIRATLMETANEMLSHVTPSVMEGVYDPNQAFIKIEAALQSKGLLAKPAEYSTIAMSRTAIASIAMFFLERYTISVIVVVETTSEGKNLGENSDKITVSVWEDRIPQVWDRSYHDANSQVLSEGPLGKKSLGRWTRQTDSALVDYVATILSKDVTIPTTDRGFDEVRTSPLENTNRYGTSIGRPLKQGSDKFAYQQKRDIVRNAVSGYTVGAQGEYVLNLEPRAVNKTTLARYIADTIKDLGKGADIGEATVRMHQDGYYQIMFSSDKLIGPLLNEILDGVI